MPAKIDLIGKRFGRLVVLGDGERRKGRRSVICRCDCGAEIVTDPRGLTTGHAKSCGCLQREIVSVICADKVKHGMARSPEYNIWVKMKSRCYNEKDPKYSYYGGRGIKVCRQWDESFDAFFSDMGKKPSREHSIDRIDVNGNYEPSNCRWATAKTQSRNKRNHRLVEYCGKKIPLSEACEKSGVNYRSALYRLNKGLDWLLPAPPAESEK
jgi:hypothetical protein